MDEGFNNIEELLKGTLDGYKKQPSPKVWRAVSLKLFFSSTVFYASVFLLLVGIGTGSYFYFHSEPSATDSYPGNEVVASQSDNNGTQKVVTEKETVKNNNQKQNNEQITIDESIADKNNIASDISQTGTEKAVKAKSNVNVAAGQSKPLKTDSGSGFDKGMGRNDIIASPAVANNAQVKSINDKYPGLPGLDDNNIGRMQPAEPFVENRYYNNMPEYLTFKSAYTGFDLVPKSDYGRLKGAWSVGAFITPEIIFLNDEEKSTKKSINFDVTGVYGEDFFVEAGVGVALSEDNGRFNINYSQYDSVGYFYQVNSFEIDPVTGEPVFKTTLEGLYDTVDYQTSETVDNLYTYLRIPLYAGYKIREFKGFSVYLKAGGIYSVLVGSNESGTNYTNDKATSIIIEDETPQRVHSYFKLSASVGLSYMLSNSVSLSLEPVYNYYMQPVYERRLSDKSPWSLGLRFGVLVKIK
jgi:hypothetical protein